MINYVQGFVGVLGWHDCVQPDRCVGRLLCWDEARKLSVGRSYIILKQTLVEKDNDV